MYLLNEAELLVTGAELGLNKQKYNNKTNY